MSTPASPFPPAGEPKTTGLKIALVVLAALCLGLAAAIAFVASSAASDRDDQAVLIATQQRRIVALERRLGVAERQISAPDGEVSARLAKVQRRVKQLEDCMPELQTEVNNMEIDRDTLYISPSNQISRVCWSTLYGEVNGDR